MILGFILLLTMSAVLERVERDIPSILYNSLTPKQCPLYDSLKTDCEVVKANYEAGLKDLDGYMGLPSQQGPLDKEEDLLKMLVTWMCLPGQVCCS